MTPATIAITDHLLACFIVPHLFSKRVHEFAGWCMVCIVVVLSVAPLPSLTPVTENYDDKIAHGLVYSTLMFWFALVRAPEHWRRLALAIFALGLGLEVAQALLPYRTASLADAVANGLGVALGAVTAWLFTRAGGTGPGRRGRAE